MWLMFFFCAVSVTDVAAPYYPLCKKQKEQQKHKQQSTSNRTSKITVLEKAESRVATKSRVQKLKLRQMKLCARLEVCNGIFQGFSFTAL